MTPAEAGLVFAWMFVLVSRYARDAWDEGNRIMCVIAALAAALFLTNFATNFIEWIAA